MTSSEDLLNLARRIKISATSLTFEARGDHSKQAAKLVRDLDSVVVELAQRLEEIERRRDDLTDSPVSATVAIRDAK